MQALNNRNEERYGMFTSGDMSKPRHYLNRYCQVNSESAKVTSVCRYLVVIIFNIVSATLANDV